MMRANRNSAMSAVTAFVSYSSPDRLMALHLSDKLRQSGITTWIDQIDIHPGDDIVGRIESGIL